MSIVHVAGDDENTTDFGAIVNDGYASMYRSIQFRVAKTEDGDPWRGAWNRLARTTRSRTLASHFAATIDSTSDTPMQLFLDGEPKPSSV